MFLVGKEKIIGVNNLTDVLFLCFPIWLPGIFLYTQYFHAATLFPIVLLAFFIIREAHFGITWIFFFNSANRRWAKEQPIAFCVVPIGVLVILYAVLELKGVQAAYFVTNLASIIHVTRQSVGVNKIYCMNEFRAWKWSELMIYVLTGLFVSIGYLRFYTGIELSQDTLNILTLAGGICCLLVPVSLSVFFKFQLAPKFLFSMLTGVLIYFPYCFVDRSEYANILGVSMHWFQYLALVVPIYSRRAKESSPNTTTGLDVLHKIATNPVNLFSYIVVYVCFLLLLRRWGDINSEQANAVATLIILASYNLHFYYDALIWRFSVPHIRREVGAFLFRKI